MTRPADWIRVDGLPDRYWLDEPQIVKGGGPERVATEEPPDDWTPTPLLGFAAPVVEREPLTWDGDGA